MVHQVRTHRPVQSQLERHFQLGPHPVRRAHQNRVLPPLQIQPEQRAKPANPSQHIAVKGLLRQKLDALLGPIASADVYAGVGVRHGFLFGFVRHSQDFLVWDSMPARMPGKVDSSSIRAPRIPPAFQPIITPEHNVYHKEMKAGLTSTHPALL